MFLFSVNKAGLRTPSCRQFATRGPKSTGPKPKPPQDWALNVQNNAAVNVALNDLRDNPGAKKQKKRLGRGPASGTGKTAGRGAKGQKARSGHNIPRGFEGGQSPIWKNTRKYGFSNAMFARRYALVNLDRLQQWIDKGKLSADETITMGHLFKSRAAGKLRRNQVGVKILGKGADKFTHKINLEVSQISDTAKDKIIENGGTVLLLHYNKVGMKSLTHPEKFTNMPYLAPPIPKVNRKLKKPMEQPQQHPQWITRQEQIRQQME